MKQILLFILTITFAACASTPADITSLESAYVTVNDSVNIHYKSYGEGPKTILFIHGFGCDMNVWEEQFDAFKVDKDLRLVFVDLPGYGLSDKPHVDYTFVKC